MANKIALLKHMYCNNIKQLHQNSIQNNCQKPRTGECTHTHTHTDTHTHRHTHTHTHTHTPLHILFQNRIQEEQKLKQKTNKYYNQ